ncbi:MAG TPA: endolytic transglycosylase MltG, partial [Candidatus Dormibacteraeota bacterium]|nr:endolytic transglycosylase MltG [Candidatus Dormibacteraeota bacterium]
MKNLLRILAALIGAAVLVAISIAAWFLYGAYIDRSHPSVATQVVIVRGSTFDQVAQRLAGKGVIASAPAFRVLAKLGHDATRVRAGAYRFVPHQSEEEVLHALLSGSGQVAYWVTIPEGFTAKQIAARLQSAGIGRAAAFERTFVETSLNVGGVRTPNLEGYLFPSTYLVPVDATPSQVAKQLTGQFFAELPANAAVKAKALHVTLPQVVTVASLIEREAKVDADRPLIAGVIYNRLRIGMPLQVDATIEYALPHHAAALTYADLAIRSPYNSYLHRGLPPTPIANPGL